MALRLLLATLITFCAGTSALGGVIFSQETATTTFVASDSDFGTYSQTFGAIETADSFILKGNAILRSVTWFGGYDFSSVEVPPGDNFTIRLFVDNGAGLPQETHFAEFIPGNAVNRTDTGFTFTTAGTSYREFAYAADLADTVLTAGTKYYISIVNDTSAVSGGQWGWSHSSVSDTDHWRRHNQTSNDWALHTFPSSSRSSLAFALHDINVASASAVPEPATLGMIGGMGFIGLLIGSRRRKSLR